MRYGLITKWQQKGKDSVADGNLKEEQNKSGGFISTCKSKAIQKKKETKKKNQREGRFLHKEVTGWIRFH